MVTVNVRFNNVDGAIRTLKKSLQVEGTLSKYKKNQEYKKPSEKRNEKRKTALRRKRNARRAE